MTFGMQIRRWYNAASPVERWRTIGIASIVAAALVASVFAGANGGPTSTEALSSGQSSGAAGDKSLAAAGSLTSLPTTPGASGTSPSGSGGGSLAANGGPGVGSSGVGSSSGDVGPGTPAPGPGGVALTASDRGVTPTAIRIGFLPANVGGLSGSGYALNIRTDAGQYAQALVDEVNRTGGVAGRKLQAFVRPTDPTSQSDQAAACQSMVNDSKVFGVVDVGSISDTPYMDCIAIQNRTPYVHNTIWDTHWLARSGGMEVGYPAAIDRITATWTRDLTAMHWLGNNAVVGILGENCEAASPVIDNVLRPAIAAMPGVKNVVVVKSDCSPQGVVGQPSSFVPTFRLAGVTNVFVVTSFVSAAVFMSAAEGQGYRPKYTTSDWWQLSSDSSSADFNANQFDGAIAISSLGLGLPAAGKPPYPGGARCQKVAADAKMPALAYDGRNQELWGLCDNFFLMIDALQNAGANPTRVAWAQAVQHLGEHPSVMFGKSLFAPGKVTGSDEVMTLQWRRDCTCYRPITGLRPAAK